MRSRADLEPVFRGIQSELVEEDLRKLAVVVLARVEDDLIDLVSKCEGQGSRLDELAGFRRRKGFSWRRRTLTTP